MIFHVGIALVPYKAALNIDRHVHQEDQGALSFIFLPLVHPVYHVNIIEVSEHVLNLSILHFDVMRPIVIAQSHQNVVWSTIEHILHIVRLQMAGQEGVSRLFEHRLDGLSKLSRDLVHVPDGILLEIN